MYILHWIFLNIRGNNITHLLVSCIDFRLKYVPIYIVVVLKKVSILVQTFKKYI